MSSKHLQFDDFFDEAIKNIPPDYEPIKIEARNIENENPLLRLGDYPISAISPIDRVDLEDNPWGDLNDDERRLIDGAARNVGAEIIAFYKSKRLEKERPFPGSWGIYYLKKGLRRVQEQIESDTPYRDSVSAEKALDLVRRHEWFHYKFDLWALTVESAKHKNLYMPLKEAFRYSPNDQVEEALANQDAYNWARTQKQGLKDFAVNFMSVQPGAYRRYIERRTDLLAELGGNLIDQRIGGSSFRYDQVLWNGQIGLYKPGKHWRPPEHLIRDVKLTALIPSYWSLPKISNIVESSKFQKSLKKLGRIGEKWMNTKDKLIREPGMNGLNFKEWPDGKCFSVRVDQNFRAHINPKNEYSGAWEAIDIGNHKKMGHG
jgi:hypothetical protein